MGDVRKRQICYNQAKTSSVASGVVILSQAFTFFKICKKKKVVFYGPSSIHVKIVDKKHDSRERSHFFLVCISGLAPRGIVGNECDFVELRAPAENDPEQICG